MSANSMAALVISAVGRWSDVLSSRADDSSSGPMGMSKTEKSCVVWPPKWTKYPPVLQIKRGNGRYPIYRWLPNQKAAFYGGFIIATFDIFDDIRGKQSHFLKANDVALRVLDDTSSARTFFILICRSRQVLWPGRLENSHRFHWLLAKLWPIFIAEMDWMIQRVDFRVSVFSKFSDKPKSITGWYNS